MKQFKETGSVNNRPQSGRSGLDVETVLSAGKGFKQIPQKSLKRASLELRVSKTEVHKTITVKQPQQPSKIQVHAMLQEENNQVQLTCHQRT